MDLLSYLLSRKYTDNSIKGISGVLAGKNCTIESATKQNGITTVVFKWTADDGTVRRTSIQVEDGDAGATYDDTEIKQDIADIWKVQGELGVKNLLAYPYTYTATNPFVMNGITYTFYDDGSINMNGSNTSYSTCHLHRAFELYPHGDYIISCEGLIQGVELQFGYVNGTTFYGRASATYAKPSKQFSITDEFDGYQLGVRIIVNPNTTVDNITLYPMIRLASDTDDTWQPYAPTNYQLNQKVDTIAGVYLPNATNINFKKAVASVGQTSVTFDANSFMTKYNVTASDLDLDISAETQSGDVVAYSNVSVTGGIVTVTFDALSEQTTFICKCSVIQ